MRSIAPKALLATVILTLLSACAEQARLPDLEAIYRATRTDSADQPPLITIPGTLGSRLVDDASGTVIWGGGSRGISGDPDDPDEFRLMALPIGRGSEPLSKLRDSIRPAGILDIASVEFLGIPVMIDIYGGTRRTLDAGGFRTAASEAFRQALTGQDDDDVPIGASEPPPAPPEDFNAFRFDYDWRRDLIETAHDFGHYLEARRDLVASQRGIEPDAVKFDLIAHSMGGLIARFFLMYGFAGPAADGTLPPITWAGAEFFSRVVLVAPPNAGSITAFDNLIHGKSLGPLQPHFPAALLGTHPSAYQLMPRPRHRRVRIDGEDKADLYDVKLWERMGWGLAAPEASDYLAVLMPDEPDPSRRHARALAHIARSLARARAFHRMMDRWAPTPPGLDLFLVVGGGFETPATGEIGVDGRFAITGVEEGDGVVLRASVLLDERMDGDTSTGLRSPLRFKTTLFLPDEHIELTKNPVFGDNLLFWLLEAPRPGEDLRRPERAEMYTPATGDPKGARSPEIFISGSDQ